MNHNRVFLRKWFVYIVVNDNINKSWFPRYDPIFKIAIYGHETWQVAKVPEVSHTPSCNPIGSKLSLFLSLYFSKGRSFRDRGTFSKLPYLGMKLVARGQSSRICSCTLFLRQWVGIELIFAPQAVGSETQANFQNCHIWA